MGNRQNTRNWRGQGGSTWYVSGELEVESSGSIDVESGGKIDIESGGAINVESGGTIDVESGGTLDFESGGYITRAHVDLTTHAASLVIGALNQLGTGGTTGMYFNLPTPVAGAEVKFWSTDATTGRYVVYAGSTGVDIGSSTEAGVFADTNDGIAVLGGPVTVKAVSSTGWIVIYNPGDATCGAFSTAMWSTA